MQIDEKVVEEIKRREMERHKESGANAAPAPFDSPSQLYVMLYCKNPACLYVVVFLPQLALASSDITCDKCGGGHGWGRIHLPLSDAYVLYLKNDCLLAYQHLVEHNPRTDLERIASAGG